MTVRTGLNADFLDMLRALIEAEAQFVVVGAYAMAVHGVPRATGDIDIFVRPESHNAGRVLSALKVFGAPTEAHGVTAKDLSQPGTVYQLGLPPRRIDIITAISGVEFQQAWEDRTVVSVDELPVAFLSRANLLKNKLAAGRDKDLVDVKLLARHPRPGRRLTKLLSDHLVQPGCVCDICPCPKPVPGQNLMEISVRAAALKRLSMVCRACR